MFTVVSPDFTLLFKEHPHEVDLKQVLLLKANFLSDEKKRAKECVSIVIIFTIVSKLYCQWYTWVFPFRFQSRPLGKVLYLSGIHTHAL